MLCEKCWQSAHTELVLPWTGLHTVDGRMQHVERRYGLGHVCQKDPYMGGRVRVERRQMWDDDDTRMDRSEVLMVARGESPGDIDHIRITQVAPDATEDGVSTGGVKPCDRAGCPPHHGPLWVTLRCRTTLCGLCNTRSTSGRCVHVAWVGCDA